MRLKSLSDHKILTPFEMVEQKPNTPASDSSQPLRILVLTFQAVYYLFLIIEFVSTHPQFFSAQ